MLYYFYFDSQWQSELQFGSNGIYIPNSCTGKHYLKLIF
jgi:hypothetical protein